MAEENIAMQPKPYVFGYDDEPATERPTDFGSTNFGHSGIAALSTVAGPWSASEHSTFDMPSRSFDRVQTYRERARRRNTGLAALALLALASVAAAAAWVLS
jgi:hypothetical protein